MRTMVTKNELLWHLHVLISQLSDAWKLTFTQMEICELKILLFCLHTCMCVWWFEVVNWKSFNLMWASAIVSILDFTIKPLSELFYDDGWIYRNWPRERLIFYSNKHFIAQLFILLSLTKIRIFLSQQANLQLKNFCNLIVNNLQMETILMSIILRGEKVG